MVAGLVSHVLLSCLAGHVFNTLALPNPSRPTPERAHVPLLHDTVETTERTSLEARMDGAASAIMAADIPTTPSQSQDITSTEGRNETGVIPNLSISYEGVNCSDLSTGRDNKCWEELQLTTWVQEWIVGNTCYENEPFASCFLRKVGYPELDCTGIKLATCTPPPIKEGMDSRVFYVAYNFYGPSLNSLPPFLLWHHVANPPPQPSTNTSDPGTRPSAVPPPSPASTSTPSCN